MGKRERGRRPVGRHNLLPEVRAPFSPPTMAVCNHEEPYDSRVPPRDGIARGGAIASGGIPDRDIPACAECHGPTSLPKNPTYPKLASQHVRYLRSQLAQLQ